MYFKQFSAFILLTVLLSSCEKEVEIAKKDSNKCIVANALITENQPIEVMVSRGIDYVGGRNSLAMNNANLFVYHNDTLLEEINGTNDGGFYYTSVVPKANETYTIKVDCQHYPTATATATIPNPVQIEVLQADSVHVYLDDYYSDYESYSNVVVSITDTTSDLRYYLITATGYYCPNNNPDTIKTHSLTLICNNATAKTTSMTDILNHMFESSDVEHVQTKEYILLSNKDWHGSSATISFEVRHSSAIPPDINVMSFTEDYYKYFIAKEYLKNSDDEDFMFSEPVNVYSNVHNGLGLFAGYNMATTKLHSICDTVYEE